MNKTIADKTLDMALKEGVENARVILREGSQSQLSYLNRELDKLQHSRSSSLGIELFIEDKYGQFSTNRLDPEEIRSFLKYAIDSVKLLAPDPARRLPKREYCYSGEYGFLKRIDEEGRKRDIEVKKEFILSVAEEVDLNDKRVISTTTDYDDSLEELYILDSLGFSGETSMSLFSIATECSIFSEDGTRPQEWWSENSLKFENLKRGSGKKAMERAIMMLGGRKIKSGKYPVIVENRVSNTLFSPIISALSGNSIQQNNSFLLNSLGKKVFPEKVNVIDFPHDINAIGARYFDGEGVATKKMHIIENGIVNTYFLNTYIANKLNLEPTISSPSVPRLSHFGATTQNQMIKEVGSGVLITGFNGGNCNGATGDFSFGIQGFFFEKGEIIHPIKEMNITGNLLSLWNNVLHIGNDYREDSSWHIPTLAFKNCDLSGN